jgi:hypothetical protein
MSNVNKNIVIAASRREGKRGVDSGEWNLLRRPMRERGSKKGAKCLGVETRQNLITVEISCLWKY